MSPRAGKIRNWITVEQSTETQSESGEPHSTWSTFAERYAGFETLSGREYFDAHTDRSEVNARFWLRDDVPGVTTKMRVSWDGRKFNIVAVIPPEKPGGWLQFMVFEVQ